MPTTHRHRLPSGIVTASVLALSITGLARGEDDLLRRFMMIRTPGEPTLSEDGQLYVVDWPDGVDQLYRRPFQGSLDAPLERLTDFPDGIDDYAVSPFGRTIVVSVATGGNEQTDVYGIDAATGERRPLLVDPDVVYRFQHWQPDGSGFLYTANDDSPSDFHLYRYDLETDTRAKLLDRPGMWLVGDVYDNGTRVLLSQYVSVGETYAWELNTATGQMIDLNVCAGFNRPVAYMRDGRAAAIIAEGDTGIRHVFVREFESGDVSNPLPDLAAYGVEALAINRHRNLAVVTYNRDGYRDMRLVRVPEFVEVEVPGLEPGVVGNVALTGRMLVWTLSNARMPGVAFSHKAGTELDPMQLTRVEDQGVDVGAFSSPQLVRYPTFDGREIPAFLYTPPGFEPGTPVPFVVVFHGGPEGQSRPRFSATVQYLLVRGFGVLMPNVRGSTGYGREFHLLDNGENRWDSVRDGVAAAQWLVDLGYAESGRIGAYGRSYGGFMAVAAVIEAPALFGASVDAVGIVNFRTFLERTGAYRRALREAEYGSLDDPEMLAAISPIHRIDEIQVPMLIAHGLNDPRVPVGEAMQLAVGLQKRGADPDLLFFPDEGHGLAKLENRLLFYERVVRFFERTLMPGH